VRRGFRRPIRRANGVIVVTLPDGVRHLLLDSAQRVRRSATDPASAGYVRLYAPIDEDIETADPLVTLRRQVAVDEVCGVVQETWRRERLTEGEADAWIKVLGMAVAIASASAGIETEADVEAMDPDVSHLLDLLRSLQLLLAVSVDPSLEDMEDPG
jgi:hypothetical protein